MKNVQMTIQEFFQFKQLTEGKSIFQYTFTNGLVEVYAEMDIFEAYGY